MKKYKKTPENPNIGSSPKPVRLRRYRERLEKESRDSERSRETLFRQRVSLASDRKSIKTLRTRAYYRFSKKYPSVVSPDGFRENISEKEKMSAGGIAALLICCVLVFVLTFTGVRAGITLSLKEPAGEQAEPVIADSVSRNTLFIDADYFSNNTASAITDRLKDGGYDSTVLEFKGEYGYVYFDTGTFVGESADRKIPSAREKMQQLQAAGIECIACISCFKDSAAASALAGMEVLTYTGELFRDSSGDMWLDPYSYASQDYITGLVSAASDMGFDGIMLDNVCFPADYYLAAPVYLSYEEGNTKNDALIQFINAANEAAGSAELIVCGDITAFAQLSSIPDERHGGTLLASRCTSYCLDFREKSRYEVQLKNTELFRYVEEMPLAFILDAGALAVNELSQHKTDFRLYALTDNNDAKTVQYVNYAEIGNIISVLPD